MSIECISCGGVLQPFDEPPRFGRRCWKCRLVDLELGAHPTIVRIADRAVLSRGFIRSLSGQVNGMLDIRIDFYDGGSLCVSALGMEELERQILKDFRKFHWVTDAEQAETKRIAGEVRPFVNVHSDEAPLAECAHCNPSLFEGSSGRHATHNICLHHRRMAENGEIL